MRARLTKQAVEGRLRKPSDLIEKGWVGHQNDVIGDVWRRYLHSAGNVIQHELTSKQSSQVLPTTDCTADLSLTSCNGPHYELMSDISCILQAARIEGSPKYSVLAVLQSPARNGNEHSRVLLAFLQEFGRVAEDRVLDRARHRLKRVSCDSSMT